MGEKASATTFQKQLSILKELQSEAQEKIDYDNANNPSYLHAISIVEEFLRRTGRICYGGQAINAHLPKRLKIYDPDYTLPDYDFFTPNPEADLLLLQSMLEKEGFLDIHKKEGIHEGTTKVYVMYTAVADMTYLDERIYEKLSSEALVQNGIKYADANFLQMMMHLELSRPRGEVERWDKVYERLLLLQSVIPKRCGRYRRTQYLHELPYRKTIVDFIKYNKLIFAGADVFTLMKKEEEPIENLVVGSRNPIIMFSQNIQKDTRELVKHLEGGVGKAAAAPGREIRTKYVAPVGDIVPAMKLVYAGKYLLAMFVEINACLSYIQSHNIRIASLDTLFTLFLSFRYIRLPPVSSESILCLIESMTAVQKKIRLGKHLLFPAFSLDCEGHQSSFPSLLRARKERLKEKMGKTSASSSSGSKTKKLSRRI